MYLEPYDLLTESQRRRIDLAVMDELKRAKDAALMYLEHGPRFDHLSRRRVVVDLMTHATYRQAELLGLVDCGQCGDQGCDLCGPDVVVTPRNLYHLAPAWADEPTGLAIRSRG
jgi:hypothetical protein